MFLGDLKEKIKIVFHLSFNADMANLNFSYPPNAEMGDLSLACFELAKKERKNPAELAQKLAQDLVNDKELKKYFSEIKALGPYLNFFISPEYAAQMIISEIKKAGTSYGSNNSGDNKKVMIEYSNGNTHKEYHVGHLRNISYGDAINRLLAVNGFESIPVSYINDFGIHTAKTIWNWRRHPEYASQPESKGYLLGKCYAAASQELEAHPEYKEEVGKIMSEIESRQGENYKLWQETRQWSIDYFASIYKELGISFQETFYENEVIDAGLQLVKELLAKKILKKSEGAIIADLEEYGLGVLPIIRSDGTALYPVADLALASEKFKKYDLFESIYVVDIRQSLYFKQLFKLIELLGYKQPLVHLPYDFVTLPGGMMASRSGNVVTYKDLKDKLTEKLEAETKKRHDDWSGTKIRTVAEMLGVATMKFEMLKVSAEKIITFNIEEAAKFDGYTACYIQYGYARLKSIIRKQGFNFSSLFTSVDLKQLKEKKEKNLLLKAARYPEIIASAAKEYNPSELTKYLFELTQMVNDYYHEVNILKAASNIKRARLALIKAVGQVIKNGLGVLGIEVLEEM